MKNKNAVFIVGLIILLSSLFTACHNSIMETWWEEPSRLSGNEFYRVQFNAGVYAQDPGDQLIAHGAKIARVPAMITGRTDVGFGGWFTDQNFTREWNFANDIVTSDVTLYARWVDTAAELYTVKFEAGYPPGGIGGSGPTPPNHPSLMGQIIALNSLIVEPSPLWHPDYDENSNRIGFGGWFLRDPKNDPLWDRTEHEWNFATQRLTSSIASVYAPSGTLTLYALWVEEVQEPSYLVSFENYGGDPVPRVQSVTSGSKAVQPQAMTRDGHSFGGWYRDVDFISEWIFSSDVVTDNLILYARWIPIIYTVRFNADGGIPAPANQLINHGSLITRPAAIRKTGEGFLGWYSPYDGYWDFDVPVTGDLTLYAQWGNPDIIVSFELTPPLTANPTLPGYSNPPDQVIGNNSRITEPPPPPSTSTIGEIWHFDGWYYFENADDGLDPEDEDDRNELIPWNFDMVVSDSDDFVFQNPDDTHSFTLYARWVPNEPGMTWVRRGSFMMGSSSISASGPVRRVELDGFYIYNTEITQELYEKVFTWAREPTSLSLLPLGHSLGTQEIILNPSQHHGSGGETYPNHPVERVSWYDAVHFSNLMTAWYNAENSPTLALTTVYTLTDFNRSGSSPYTINTGTATLDLTGTGFRLPTEAEWEYAARGGNGSPGNFTFSGSNNAEDVAWFNTNSGLMTQPVGLLNPNALGLYDMNGNVSEWCWDYNAPYSDFVNPAQLINPRGPDSGTQRIRRGGAYSNAVNNIRNVVRNSAVPTQAEWVNGFRVVRNASIMW